MKKQKEIETNGKITIVKSEERYPYSSEILMCHGFKIIFLNMVLGLLPVTIWGSRMKYFKCSISQLYTFASCISFIIFTAVFLQTMFKEGDDEQGANMANTVVLVTLGITHIVGYLILLIRGHFVAHKLPFVWTKLCKLLQIAVVDVYGKRCHHLKEARKFSCWAVGQFGVVMASTMFGVVFIADDYGEGMNGSCDYYGVEAIIPEFGRSPLQHFQYVTLNLAYFLWISCKSNSHVLVTMLLCYIIVIITICLKSVNQQIQEFLQVVGINQDCKIMTRTPKTRFNWFRRRSNKDLDFRAKLQTEIDANDEVALMGRLDTIKTVYLIIEDLLGTVSRLWGISLLIEVLILITTGTKSMYDLLKVFQNDADIFGNLLRLFEHEDEWMSLVITVSVHFFFLFKCCIYVNKMHFEANNTLQLLKQSSNSGLSLALYEKVEELKGDLASMSLTLSATNYFQIHKGLLTSVFSQITTYVIVLLQFGQKMQSSGSAN